jgi:hypothetical protein
MYQQPTEITINTRSSINTTNTGGIIPNISVSLTVLDGSGEPAINASLQEKNTNNYASTDLDGVVKLANVNSYNTVVINYQGQTKEFRANELPKVYQFATTELDTVYITNEKSYAWLGWLALAGIGVIVGKAILDEKKPLKVTL